MGKEDGTYTPYQIHKFQQLNELISDTKFLVDVMNHTQGDQFVFEEERYGQKERYFVDPVFLVMCKGGALGIYRELVAEDCKEEAVSIIEKYDDQTRF